MFDPFNVFSPSRDEFKNATEKTSAYCLALATVLLEKGIMTNEEFNVAYSKALQLLDQEWARMRDEKKKEEEDAGK